MTYKRRGKGSSRIRIKNNTEKEGSIQNLRLRDSLFVPKRLSVKYTFLYNIFVLSNLHI